MFSDSYKITIILVTLLPILLGITVLMLDGIVTRAELKELKVLIESLKEKKDEKD